jgi:hypothetical protein
MDGILGTGSTLGLCGVNPGAISGKTTFLNIATETDLKAVASFKVNILR